VRRIIKQKILKACLVVGLFVFIFLTTYHLNQAYLKKHTDLVRVSVARKEIPAYSRVTREDITFSLQTRSSLPPDSIFDPDGFFQGRSYFTGNLGFGPGDVIRSSRLNQNSLMPFHVLAQLQENKQMLVTIQTNLVQSCSNFVEPGALVNAFVFIKGNSHDIPDRIISPLEEPHLGNLLVFDIRNAEGQKLAEEGREALPAVVTLVLDSHNLDAAKVLVEYNETGNIYLVPIGFDASSRLCWEAAKPIMKEWILSEGFPGHLSPAD
jgi:Flp pilus assembly protein CpaB